MDHVIVNNKNLQYKLLSSPLITDHFIIHTHLDKFNNSNQGKQSLYVENILEQIRQNEVRKNNVGTGLESYHLSMRTGLQNRPICQGDFNSLRSHYSLLQRSSNYCIHYFCKRRYHFLLYAL